MVALGIRSQTSEREQGIGRLILLNRSATWSGKASGFIVINGFFHFGLPILTAHRSVVSEMGIMSFKILLLGQYSHRSKADHQRPKVGSVTRAHLTHPAINMVLRRAPQSP